MGAKRCASETLLLGYETLQRLEQKPYRSQNMTQPFPWNQAVVMLGLL